MNPEAFLKEFGHLAETEAGRIQLRALVHDLAIQGRLIDQRETEAPAPVPGIEGLPAINLPESWRWALPDTLAATTRHALTIGPFGSSLLKSDYTDSGVPLVFVRDVTSNSFGNTNPRFVSRGKAEELKAHTVRPGDLLITKMGTPPGDTAIYPKGRPDGIVTADVVKFTANSELILTEFLQLAINSPQVKLAILGITMGVAHQKISLKRFREVPLPLPPLPEQKRIVAKVDQLMVLCDELEARQKQKREKAVALNKAALSAVVHAPDKSRLKSSWSRVQDHFEVLYELPENVKELRQTILQLAVMGKLVEHDDNVQEVVPLEPTGSPFHRSVESFDETMRVKGIPRSWSCTRFGLLADVASGLTKGRKLAGRKILYLPYLRVANVQRGWLDLGVVKDIEVAEDEVSRYVLEVGDVLLTEGGDADKLGRSAIWRAELPLSLHQNHVFRARPSVLVRSEWLSTFTNSPVGRTYFLSAAKQTTNLASINMTQLRNCPVPLPSLREQDRILNKVQQFMSLCDDLDAKLAQHRDQGQRLMQAVVEGLVA